jgi:hypothetical protein
MKTEPLTQRSKKRYNSSMKGLWRIWAKSLGEKSGDNDCEADRIAVIRTILALINVITCFFICAGIIRHW